MSSLRSLVCVLTLALSAVHGTLYDNAADLPTMEYDFIVVGSGPGGSVVANRLTENQNVTVLLLEAGPTNEGILNIEVPLFTSISQVGGPLDWNYTSTPQPGMNNRTFPVQRGFTLGGTTSINGMIYLRGSKDDYNRYAKITGDPGWSWRRMLHYFRKGEKWTAPADHHNTSGEFLRRYHGYSGPLHVSVPGYHVAAADRIKQVTTKLPEFPYVVDHNSGKPLGVGWIHSTINVYRRDSAATSYLGPSFISRPNLHVLLNARVLRVVQTGTNGGKPSFQALQFSQSHNGNPIQVSACKEIILSAGSTNTPQILLQSGIGNQQQLSALGIQAIVNLTGVGENLSVHPYTAVNYRVNSTSTFDEIFRNDTLKNQLLQQWNSTHTGPLVDSGAPSFSALQRLPSSFPLPPQDPAAGPNTPHLILVFGNSGFGISSPTDNYISIIVELVTITSRGSVKLASTDPWDAPIIDLGILNTQFDIDAYVEGVKMARRFGSANAWNGFIIGEAGSLANATTDSAIAAWLRANTIVTGHIVGTAAMSPYNATYGVVDPDLRVKGVSGLRVVDASVWPYVPSANTQASVYGLAERAADLIKLLWAL